MAEWVEKNYMAFKRLLIPVFVLAFALGAFHLFPPGSTAATNDELAILLPESDGVVIIDSNRLFREALPQVLSSNLPMLQKINGEVDKIRDQTGLDLRKFERVAVSLKYAKQADGNTEYDTVLLARGDVSTASLQKVAKSASDGKFRTEKVGSRTVYVFTPKKLIRTGDQGKGSMVEQIFNKLFKGLSREVAITAYDSNTVAFGSAERVKATIGNTPRISGELISLLDRKPGSLANMGMIVPNGMSQFLELDDDELGASLDAIRRIQAAFDVSEGETTLSIAATTTESAQAENLVITLQAIQGLFAGIFKSNANPDKQAYSRLLESLEVTQNEKDIFIDLTVPKTDLEAILGR